MTFSINNLSFPINNISNYIVFPVKHWNKVPTHSKRLTVRIFPALCLMKAPRFLVTRKNPNLANYSDLL